MFHPLVSIVIPVYNGANYMREAIDSALAQTYDNCEVIVVNDGSTDNGETDRIARSYGDRIRYFPKENGGVATALNLGIREMRGEYFSWLSHDDVYVPEKIERQVSVLRQTADRETIVVSNFSRIDAEGKPLAAPTTPLPDPNAVFCSVYEDISIHGCTLLIPRTAFSLLGVFPEHLQSTQDYELWFSMARNLPFAVLDEPLVKARSHAEQGTLTIPECGREIRELVLRHLDDYVVLKASASGSKCRSTGSVVISLLRNRLRQQYWEPAKDIFIRYKNRLSFADTLVLYAVYYGIRAKPAMKRRVTGLARRLARVGYCIFLKKLPSQNNHNSLSVRLRMCFLRHFLKYCGENVNIQPNVTLEGLEYISIGDYSGVGADSHIAAAAPVSIGNHVMIAPELVLMTANHGTSRDSLMMFQPMTPKPVVIGSDVWIGRRVTILPGADIADGCVIAAGAVVAGKTEPYAVYGGVPARKIKDRV